MGCGKHHVQLYRTASECIIGITGQHIHALLLSRLNALVTLGYVTEHPKVHQRTTCLIITMYRKNIFALLQQVTLLTIQADHYPIHIIHDTRGGFLAIDVYFTGIIV